MNLLRRVATLAVFGTLGVASGCDPATDPIRYEDFVKNEGEGEFGVWVHSGLYNRTYDLHTPEDMEEGRLLPLLIFLHGGGDDGSTFRVRMRSEAATEAAGYITVFPDGLERSWTVGCGDCTQAERLGADDVQFLETLVVHLAEHLPVDTSKVFVAGFSQGGSLAHMYACTSAHPPAGLVTAAGLVFRDVDAACASGRSFPVVVVHGTEDPLARYNGYGLEAPLLSALQGVEMWVREMGCAGPPQVTETPDEAGDFVTVTSLRFTDCESGYPVIHHRLNGGGHTWPGPTGPWGRLSGLNTHNLDLTREMLEHFARVLDAG